MSNPDRLVTMANQIGQFFTTQPGDRAVADIADHLRKFWEPRMRAAIFAHLDAGGAGLDPPVRRAIEHWRRATTPPTPAKS